MTPKTIVNSCAIGLLLCMILACCKSHGQESSWLSFAQGVSSNKSLTLTAYPSYAPDLKIAGENKSWGFGVAALYPLGDYAFTGARLDYLGDQFWSPSVTVGCKADVQLFGRNFTPFVIGGAIIPLGGAGDDNHAVGAIVGSGVTTSLWAAANGKSSVNLYFAVEKWSIFQGVIYHPGVAATFKF